MKDLPGNETDVSYGYDLLGRMTTAQKGSLQHSFAWDALGRQVSERQPFGSMSYQYDEAGRRTRQTWNDGFFVMTDYDVAGTPTTYGYDAENRLVTTSGGVALTYDPLGRLWQTAGGTPGTTQFLYDGDQLTAEYNASGTMLRRYLHGPDDDDPLVWYEGSATAAGNARYLFANHHGSIDAVVDGTGALVAINAYDDYGIPKSGNAGRFQYTGQAWLPELGIYHYKARIYSPKLGRFMQTDPIGYDDQINLYAYVGNDPVNHADPTGLAVCTSNRDNIGYTCNYDAESNNQEAANGKTAAAVSSTAAAGQNFGDETQGTTLGDVVERISNVRDNWEKGKRGEDQARSILRQEGYVIIGEQVHVQSKSGLRIVDFLTTRNGKIMGWEAKTGFCATRSYTQVLKDFAIERQGGIIRSTGALGGGLSYGSKVKYPTGVISILDLEQ